MKTLKKHKPGATIPMVALFLSLYFNYTPCSAGPAQQNQQSPSPPPPPALKVVSWNLQWFPGGAKTPTQDQKRNQMATAQQALAQLQPDILLLQEVANLAAVTELISVLPDFRPIAVSDFGYPQNVAIATRLPAIETETGRWLPFDPHPAPAHGRAFAAIRLPDSERILLAWSVHYQSNRKTLEHAIRAREESSRQLIANVSKMADKYKHAKTTILVGGDFNASLDDTPSAKEQTLKMLVNNGWTWTHQGIPLRERLTIPKASVSESKCYDHIFTFNAPDKAAAKVVGITAVSDHNPVILELDATR